MGKRIALLINTICVVSFGFGQNLLTNGDFETGNTDGWSGLTIEDADVYAGSFSATSTGSQSVTQSFQMEVGKTYQFSVVAKTEQGESFFFDNQFNDGSWKYSRYMVVTSSDWATYTYLLQPTSADVASSRLSFFRQGSGDKWFDNISIIEIDPSGLSNNKSLLASTLFEVASGNDQSGIPPVSIQDFLNSLTISPNAEALVFASNHRAPQSGFDVPLEDGMFLRIFAENGSYEDHTIDVSDRFIVSTEEGVLDNSGFNVSNITPTLTVGQFRAGIEVLSTASFEILASSGGLVITDDNLLVDESMVVAVTGQDGSREYDMQVRAFETGNDVLTTDIGTIDVPLVSIIDIPENTRVVQLELAITVSDFASLETIIEATGEPADNISIIDPATMKLRITAENGGTQDYSFVLNTTRFEELVVSSKSYENDVANTIIVVEDNSELHIEAETNVLANSLVLLSGSDSWLYLDNIRPSDVVNDYVGQVIVNGAVGEHGVNLRVAKYAHGTVIVPHGADFNGLTVFADALFEGGALELESYTYHRGSTTLSDMNDQITSFKLKHGYMATFAENEDGTGSSKVYVAEAKDIVIPILPDELNDKVSFIRVFPWSWVTKKGYSGGGSGADLLNSGWNYDWGAGPVSTLNREYVPMRHNKNWAPFSSINNKSGSTHLLGFNEPERDDQADMTVEEALDLWPRLMESGLRLGSPAPSDGGLNWLYSFMDQANALGYRVDFVAMHWYLGGKTVQEYYNRLRDVHERTGGLPIWITEWNNGANWTNNCCGVPTLAEQEAWVRDAIFMLDTTSFVERYAFYEWVGSTRTLITDYSTPSFNPAGEVYRDNRSELAYVHDPQYLLSDSVGVVFEDGYTVSYSNQDMDQNITVLDMGATFVLTDNTWRITKRDFAINENTILEFDFRSTAEGEVHGIGFDKDDSFSSNIMFQLFGTDTRADQFQQYNNYDGSGNWVSYSIPLGQFITGGNLHLLMVNDNDAGTGNDSQFRNIRVYDPEANLMAGTPTSLVADAIGETQVNVLWEHANNSDGYILERSLDGANYVEIASLESGTNFYVDAEVLPDTQYTYRIRSFNLNGASDFSPASQTTTPINFFSENVALSQPTTVDSQSNGSTGGDNAVDGNRIDDNSRWLSSNSAFPHWIEVDLGDEMYVYGYQFWTGFSGYNRPLVDYQFQTWDGTAWVDQVVITGNSNPIHEGYFEKVLTDRVRVYATAGTDNFARIFELEVYGARFLPVAPLSLSGTNTTNTQIELSWEDNSLNELGFIIERQNGSGVYEVVDSIANTSYIDMVDFSADSYTYRVSAYNDNGTSPFTNEVIVNKIFPPNSPSAEISGTNNNNQTFVISWIDQSNNELGFTIERRTNGGFVEVATTAPDISSFEDSDVSLEVRDYIYRVSSFNVGGSSSYTNEVTIVLNPPSAPASLGGMNPENVNVQLTWEDQSIDELGFIVERQEETEFVVLDTLAENSTSFLDETVDFALEAYVYRVSSFNAGGVAAANQITVNKILPPSTPLNFIATLSQSNTISISWDKPGENEEGFVLDRKINDGVFDFLDSLGAEQVSYIDSDVSEDNTYAYRLTAFNSIGGNSSFTDEVSVEITVLGIGDSQDIVFPNPFKDVLIIDFGDNPITSKEILIELIDLSGKTVLKRNFDFETRIELDLGDEGINLSKGSYILSIESESVKKKFTVIKD